MEFEGPASARPFELPRPWHRDQLAAAGSGRLYRLLVSIVPLLVRSDHATGLEISQLHATS